ETMLHETKANDQAQRNGSPPGERKSPWQVERNAPQKFPEIICRIHNGVRVRFTFGLFSLPEIASATPGLRRSKRPRECALSKSSVPTLIGLFNGAKPHAVWRGSAAANWWLESRQNPPTGKWALRVAQLFSNAAPGGLCSSVSDLEFCHGFGIGRRIDARRRPVSSLEQ
ncbi:MAG: hypothetical protein JWQ04_1547, partial [Pedosphaera sp.]|nr:hypothetical protein [Pedosphaera sp.]